MPLWFLTQDPEVGEGGEEAATAHIFLGQAEISCLSRSSLHSDSGLETSYRCFSDLSGQ